MSPTFVRIAEQRARRLAEWPKATPRDLALIVGQDEWNWLCERANENGMKLGASPGNGVQRVEFNQMAVYLVDAPSFLAVTASEEVQS